jgi:hypothetical protein
VTLAGIFTASAARPVRMRRRSSGVSLSVRRGSGTGNESKGHRKVEVDRVDGALDGWHWRLRQRQLSEPATSSATQSTTAWSAGASTAQTGTATSATAPAASATGAAVSGITSPGTALPVGAAATVPYTLESSSPGNASKVKLQVTVKSIEKGTLADFNGVKLDATQKASTPFYIKVKITNVGAGDAGTPDNPAIQIEGVDSTGETQQSVTFLFEFRVVSTRIPRNRSPTVSRSKHASRSSCPAGSRRRPTPAPKRM